MSDAAYFEFFDKNISIKTTFTLTCAQCPKWESDGIDDYNVAEDIAREHIEEQHGL